MTQQPKSGLTCLCPPGYLKSSQSAEKPEGMAEFLADLQRSRTKYPKNGRMFDGLMGEVDELRRAYAGDGDVRAEAFDVAVCAFRIATEGDAGGNTTLYAQSAQQRVWQEWQRLIGAIRAEPTEMIHKWRVLELVKLYAGVAQQSGSQKSAFDTLPDDYETGDY